MEIINLEEFLGESLLESLENFYDEVVVDTLEDTVGLQEAATDILLETMEDEGATHSDLAFAAYIIERYKNVLNDILDDYFDVEDTDECCDCDNCACCELKFD